MSRRQQFEDMAEDLNVSGGWAHYVTVNVPFPFPARHRTSLWRALTVNGPWDDHEEAEAEMYRLEDATGVPLRVITHRFPPYPVRVTEEVEPE